MRFETLWIESFLSFGPNPSTLDLRDCGITLIEGDNRDEVTAKSNGSGKSAIVDALVWCLYGTTLRGYEGDDVINRHVGKECCVKLTMTDGDIEYLVIRARKHTDWKTGLRLFRTEAGATLELTGPIVSETQTQIEKLVGMTFTTFLNSVVFGQTAAYRFSLLTDKEQKAVFDDALGIAQYAAARDLAAGELRSLKGGADALRGIIAEWDRRIAVLTTRRADVVTEIENFDAQQATKRAQLTDRLRMLGKMRAEEERALLGLSATTEEDAKAAESAAQAEHTNTYAAKVAAKAALENAEDAVEAHKARMRKARKLDGVCATCGVAITAAHRDTHLADLENQHDAAVCVMLDAERHHSAVDRAWSEAGRTLRTTAETLAEARRLTLARIRHRDMIARHREDRRRVKADLAELATASPHVGTLATLDKDIATHRATLAADIATLHGYDDRLAVLTFWVDAFGPKGIRSLLIDTALPLLNQRAAEFAAVLTDGNITIEFKTSSTLKSGATSEKFEVAVVSANGAGGYRGHSAGERAKIDLCVGLALQSLVSSRTTSRVNVAFFDEVFEGLDAVGVELAVEVLNGLASKFESLFVITHHEELKAYFPSSIVVTKRGGQSFIA